jgi:hypothetical protein
MVVTRPRRARAGRRQMRRLVINWELVEQRRITAGLTHTQLAERVGAAAVTGPVRLWQDGGHDAVPLGLSGRLCQVPDLHPVELFRAPHRAAHRRTVTVPEQVADEQVLEAAGHPPGTGRGRTAGDSGQPDRAGRRAGVAAAPVGRGHRRPRRHTGRPRCRLDVDVVGRGQAMQGLAPRPGLLTPAQREALHRLVDAEEALDVDTVRVLYAAAAPELLHRTPPAISAAGALRLQQLGLVRRRDRAHDLELTDDARYALLLDRQHTLSST